MKILGYTIREKHGRYYLRRFLPGRKEKWEALTKVSDGEAALLRKLAEFERQKENAERVGDFTKWTKEFRSTYKAEISTSVCVEYDRQFACIDSCFVEYDVADVDPGIVLEFLKKWSSKPNARAKYKARLSSFFSWCVLNSKLTGVTSNPCREIRLPRGPKRRGRMNSETFWAIHDKLVPKGKCMLELLFLTRQRPTEIRLLRESAIGPERIRFIPTKTRDSTAEEVEVVITPEIQAVLERSREIRDAETKTRQKRHKVVKIERDPYLFQSRQGLPYTRWGFKEMWRDACIAAGITGVTSRDVRPFALVAMERAGYSLDEIRKAAAHSTTDMTEHYLNQHRDRVSSARLTLPERQK